MEITNDFVQFFIDKAQAEIGELSKTKVFLTAQVEFLGKQLEAVKAEVTKLKEETDVIIANLKQDAANAHNTEKANKFIADVNMHDKPIPLDQDSN